MTAYPSVPLGEICIARTGTRDPRKTPEDAFRYVDIASVDNQSKRITEAKTLSGRDAPSRARRIIQTDDVLASMTRPNLNAVAMVPPYLDGEICSTGFGVLRAGEYVLPAYLFYFVTSQPFIRTACGAVSGALYPAITEKFLRSVEIPLPPLDEQRRIVDILNRAASIQRLRDQANAKLRELIPALFIKMFGDPSENTMGWEVRPLGDMADVQGGLQVTKKRVGCPIERPYLRVANVHRDQLMLDLIKHIRLTVKELERVRLEAGDLLIVEGHGNAGEVGRVASWDGSIVDCVHQNHLIRARTDRSVLLPEFAAAYLNSASGRQHLVRSGKTTSGLNTISASNVKSCQLFVPPLDLQTRYAEIVASARGIATTAETATETASAVSASLTARLFGDAA